MRIAYVVHKLPPSLGGTELYTWSLARHMAGLGHEVHLFAPVRGSAPTPTVREGVHIWPVALPAESASPVWRLWHSFRNRRVEHEFVRFLAAVRPEVVHFQHLQDVSARLLALARSLPRALTLHDYWFHCANGQLLRPDGALCPPHRTALDCARCALHKAGTSPQLAPLAAPLMAYRNAYVRRMAGLADVLLTPSAFSREAHIARGWDGARIVILENGLDLGRIRPGAIADSLLPTRGRLTLGYLGSIAWPKGLHVLIEALNALPTDVTLMIYGDATLFPDYVASLQRALRHPGVRFAGPLAPESVGIALRALDYLVVPSVWYEGYPLVLQEAEAVGTPVVASRLGALTHIEDGRTGRLFTAGDADDLARVLHELYDRPALRAEYAARLSPGKSLAEQAERLIELYGELIGR